MLKKFTEGLVFGGGFAIAFVAIWYATDFLLSPAMPNHKLQRLTAQPPQMERNSSFRPIGHSAPDPTGGKQFYDLTLDEQINQASVIALATYEMQPDGRLAAIIKEFLKNAPGTTIYHNIGEEYPGSSHYPKDNTVYGDGVLIFFTGSPATMRLSMTYSGDRIGGLGDMPMDIFRSKCKQ
jgi:hypothetical protein